MALYNEILVGRYNRALQKVLGIKGAPPAPQLSTEILAMLAFLVGVENRYLEGWDRFGIAQGPGAGGVGLFSAVALRNPVGSNMIGVIEKINAFAPTGGTSYAPKLVISASSSDLTTVNSANAFRLDARSIRSNPTLVPSQTSNFGAQPTVVLNEASLAVPGNYDFIQYENQELPLLPGDRLVLVSDTGNLGLQASILWRERFLEESERT